MSVLCCRVPDFLFGLALRSDPNLAGRPAALLGPDERVWAASPQARQCGVLAQMTPRQAQMRCPDAQLRPLLMEECQREQQLFLAELGRWELPVEEVGWGAAYVDLHGLAYQPREARLLAADAGRRLRAALGAALQPAIGWDTGKFTARAAALNARPGAMRLVGKADEVHFLAPLPITLLPLPDAALHQLYWLGIRTLGEFAALPPAGVWQRFGQAGKIAQRLAQGKDDRPVTATLRAAPETISLDIDPPARERSRTTAAIMGAVSPRLKQLERALTGCRRLQLRLCFVGGEEREISVTFVEPVSQEARLRVAIDEQIAALVWPNELEGVECVFREIGELPAGQLTLFPAVKTDVALAELARKLTTRYGSCFFRGALLDVGHPIAGRRSRLTAFE